MLRFFHKTSRRTAGGASIRPNFKRVLLRSGRRRRSVVGRHRSNEGSDDGNERVMSGPRLIYPILRLNEKFSRLFITDF
jgi:hypothetical protein